MSEEQARAYYDEFSERYERGRDIGYHALVDELELSTVLPRAGGKEVLELGCGTGLLLERVAGVASRAVGIDLSPGMLERARARGLDVIEGSVTSLPFPDGAFDLVYSFKVLPHVPDLQRALEEARRVTRPGGTVVAEFYNRESLRYAVKRLAGPRKIGASRDESDVFTRWDSPREVRSLLPPGLRIEETVGIRIVTPLAMLHRAPRLGAGLGALERRLARSPLKRFGGFYVLVLNAC